MAAYYNEIDPHAAQWLQNLMDAGHIAPGVIDTRSIEDVLPDELAGYTQCHFFAGIGVWSLALRAAGWPDSRPAWTGSCPCQPFSAAGKGAGFADERHLWPAWQHLINQCRPAVIFGEQVASKAVGPWIDLVHADLEGMGYAFGCVPFPSAGVGSPHPRERSFWLADAEYGGCERREPPRHWPGAVMPSSIAGRMGDANRSGSQPGELAAAPAGHGRTVVTNGGVRGLADAKLDNRGREAATAHHITPESDGPTDRLGGRGCASMQRRGPTNGHWGAADWLACTDGKWRPVEPGTFPLAHGIANRVGRLRAYGNAINARAAQAFIESYCEARGLIGLAEAA
jgi:DNA (cytosine-5)-methyltransferase 1